jgi:hypothetical protein
MRTREYRFYKRSGGAIWKNGEYLIEAKIDEDGWTQFQYWASIDARVIGSAETLDEAIDDCADHKKGQKVLKFNETETPGNRVLPLMENEPNPFAPKEQSS